MRFQSWPREERLSLDCGNSLQHANRLCPTVADSCRIRQARMEKRIIKTSETKLPETAPESFEQLCGILLPRPVHDEAENREMIRVMDWIAVRAHNQDQFDYAKMLGSLVTEYEVSQKRRTKPQLAGLELLKAVTESSGMTQAELAKLLEYRARNSVQNHVWRALDHPGSCQASSAPFQDEAGGVLGSRLIDKLFFDHPWKHSNNPPRTGLAYKRTNRPTRRSVTASQ